MPGILLRQLGVGALTGIALGAMFGFISWGLIASNIFIRGTADPADLAVVVALSAFSVLVVGAIIGSGLPVILRRFGLDPALASSIILTLITDIVGFGGFLLMANWLL